MKALLLLALLSVPAAAQDPPEPRPAAQGQEALDRASVEAAIKVLESVPQDDATKAAIATWRKALTRLDEARQARQRAERLEDEARRADALLAALEQALAAEKKPPTMPGQDQAIEQLETGLRNAEADRKVANDALEEARAAETSAAQRSRALPAELAAERAALQKQRAALEAVADTRPEGAQAEADRGLLRAEVQAREQRLRALEAEQRALNARPERRARAVDLARRRLETAQGQVDAWQARLLEARRQQAAEAEQVTRRKEIEAHPVLGRLARDNEELASRSVTLTNALLAAQEEQATLERRQQELRDRAKDVYEKVQAVGFNEVTGLLLRREYKELPPLGRLEDRIAADERRISEALYQEILFEERARKLEPLDDRLAEVGLALGAEIGGPVPAELSGLARELLTRQAELVEAVRKANRDLRTRLLELDVGRRAYLTELTSYRSFLDERILWIRSVAFDGGLDPASAFEALRWLVDGAAWQRVARGMVGLMARQWALFVLGLLGVAGLYALRLHGRRRLGQLAERVAKAGTDGFGLTLQALCWTVVNALPTPTALVLLAAALSAMPERVPQAQAVAQALDQVVVFLYPLFVLFAAAYPGGLFEKHFRWTRQGVVDLRRNLARLLPIGTALVILVLVLDAQDELEWRDTLGRFLFIGATLALALLHYRVLRPDGELLAGYFRRREDSWIHSARHLLHVATWLFPVALAVLALLGYSYTAVRLFVLLLETLLFLAALVFLYALTLRWLFVAKRRLALQQYEAREAKEAEEARAGREGRDDEVPLTPEPDRLELLQLNAQTRQLFGGLFFVLFVLGLYGIWRETLPALRVLDRVQIWPSITYVAGDDGTPRPPVLADRGTPSGGVTDLLPPDDPRRQLLPAAGDGAAPAAEAEPTRVTLADIGLALILIALTVLTARNLPSFLEMVVLHRLPMESGARFAIVTLVRYTITVLGALLAFGALGVGWSQVQWLVAALTFGLAFGLQEIFANFVSGLILLIERPIRIGDVVTVGETEGLVSRIRMRATTITDFDRKELLVPNREFITGRLVNWTLSDPINRLRIPVGIAYGSDTGEARRRLLQVAQGCAKVLEQPRPKALFLSFGDSALIFELRVFHRDRDLFPDLVDELHQRIDEEFRAAGITIAFPQRDLHIKDAGALVTPIVETFGPRATPE
ncbi:MAG: mechanosensitive ion channel [Planctomycetota bacterium]